MGEYYVTLWFTLNTYRIDYLYGYAERIRSRARVNYFVVSARNVDEKILIAVVCRMFRIRATNRSRSNVKIPARRNKRVLYIYIYLSLPTVPRTEDNFYTVVRVYRQITIYLLFRR